MVNHYFINNLVSKDTDVPLARLARANLAKGMTAFHLRNLRQGGKKGI